MTQRTSMLLLILVLAGGLTLTGCEEDATEDAQLDEREVDRTAGREDEDQDLAADAGSDMTGAIEIKRQGDDEVRVGQPFEYKVVARNTSDTLLHGVVLTQWAPATLEVEQDQQQLDQQQQLQADQQQRQAMDAAEGQQPGGRQQQWRIGELGPGESKEITVRGTAREEGPIRTCFAVSYDPATCTVVQAVKPELRITRKIVDDDGNEIDRAYVCDDVFVTYTVTNTGSGATGQLRMADELGQGVEPAQIDRTIESIGPGESREIERIAIKAQDSMRLRSRAVVRSSETDLAAASETGSVLLMKPELSLSVDGPRTTYLGRDATYRVRVSNTSDYPAPDTVVRFSQPEAMTDLSISTQEIEYADDAFDIGTLGPGESRDFSITFTAESPQEVQAKFVADAYCAEAKEKTIATTFRGVPALQVSTIDRADPVKVGEETTYEVRVVNEGSAEDMQIRVTADLPEKLEFVSADGDSEVTVEGNQLQFGVIDSLEPGEVASWQVRVRAKSAGKVLMKLRMQSSTRKQPAITSEPTTLY